MVAMKDLVRLGAAVCLSAVLSPAALACGSDALGTSRTLVVGTQGGPQVGLETYPRSLPLADHEVVLTFDDGPADTTPAILNSPSS